MDVTVVREQLRAMREASEARPLVFGFAGEPYDPALERFAEGVRDVFQQRGHHFRPEGDGQLRLVFNFVNPGRPRAYRRRAKATFVVAVVLEAHPPDDVLRAGYPLLVRSLANLCVYLVRHPEGIRTFFVTLEQGYYAVAGEFGSRDYFEAVYERLQPLACSQLVIDNVFEPDLPPELWEGDELTRELAEAGRRLDALGLLPAPFPIDQLLSPRDLRHIELLYGIGGLSYGNLSVRKDARRFWMSASGVNKGNLKTVGRDILMVKGYEPSRNVIVLSVPPHIEPRRVSVDAIEHWMIYTAHPRVGAIIHVHAWMEGVTSTQIQYPCGTYELARAVSELVAQSPDPNRAVVGLRNHGLTITGPSIPDILERIEGRLLTRVPMT